MTDAKPDLLALAQRALTDAAEAFLRYEIHHHAKGAFDKASANAILAGQCEEAKEALADYDDQLWANHPHTKELQARLAEVERELAEADEFAAAFCDHGDEVIYDRHLTEIAGKAQERHRARSAGKG